MKQNQLTTKQIAKFLDAEVIGDENRIIKSIKTIDQAGPDSVTFLANKLYRKALMSSNAGAVIIDKNEKCPEGMVRLVTANPYSAFRRVIDLFYSEDFFSESCLAITDHSSLAHVDPTASIGEHSIIEPFVAIAKNAQIGNNTILKSGSSIGANVIVGNNCYIGVNVVLKHNVQLGNNVRIGDGSIIGYDGFGYSFENGGYVSIPQVGTVLIEDDVHIGANCCIDRATIGETRIGKGSKLDNLIQVAHGVQIAQNTVIAAQTGISGSTRIGSYVQIGGQAGLVGHIEIGDKVSIGAQSGVTRSFTDGEVISGYPARPHRQYFRTEAHLQRLPEYAKKIDELAQKIEKLEGKK